MNYRISVQILAVAALYERRLSGGHRPPLQFQKLKLDVDTTFNQPRVLSDLGSLRPKRLFEEVPGIENCLNLSREKAPRGDVLSDGNAQGWIVVLNESLIRINVGDGEVGHPTINGGDFGLSAIDVGLESGSKNLETALHHLMLDFFRTGGTRPVYANARSVRVGKTRFKPAELPIEMQPEALGRNLSRIENQQSTAAIRSGYEERLSVRPVT